MKFIFGIFALSISFVFAGCEKNSVDNKPDVLTPKEELLTSRTWIYNEYFTKYNLSSAQVSYKLGKPNNDIDLSVNKVFFKTDKTYSEITSTGDTLKGTWRFLNEEKQLEVKNSLGVFLSDIIVLNTNNFTWHDTARNIFARMLPQNGIHFTPIVTEKLIGKKWMYSEYFTDFNAKYTSLAFKADKPNNLLNLVKNRVIFNSDGSITEIDQNGNSIPGSWKSMNVGVNTVMEVHNYAGTFVSLFIYLDDSNFVWHDPQRNTYGKMVLAGTDNNTPVPARAKILCSNNWIYTEYFSNYANANPEAVLSFKRDKQSNNTINLLLNKDTFRLDGTYTEITENGNILNGTWQFLENETKLKVINSTGTYISSIQQLNDTSFIWYDSSRSTYGKMSPSTFTKPYPIDINQLTNKTWTYYEYFTAYTTAQAKLVYKKERTSNSLNLNPNTVVFNPNGTFIEINEIGQTLNGTWDIINGNQLRTTTNAYGTFVANLIQVDSKNLIWHNPTINTYGKMIVKPL